MNYEHLVRGILSCCKSNVGEWTEDRKKICSACAEFWRFLPEEAKTEILEERRLLNSL